MAAKSKAKVLIVENGFGVTGSFRSISLFTEQLENEFEFLFAINKLSRLREVLRSNNQKYFSFSFVELQKSWKVFIYFPFLLWNTYRLISMIKKEKIKLVHVNDLYNMVGILVKWLYPHLKIVYHIRLLPTSYVGSFLYNIWIALIIRHADHVICVSKAVYDAVPSHSKVSLVYDSISKTDINIPLEDVKKDEKIVEILYLGNLIKGKGQDLALEAFARARLKNPNITLKFVGEDPSASKKFEKELNETCRKLNLSHAVSFQGFISDVKRPLREADIVLNLSESESFSMVCLEALYYGVPLIAADSGGPRELFENGKSGILVGNRDVNAAAEAILLLAESVAFRKSLSEEGKRFVREKFDLKASSSMISSIYQNMLK